METDEPKKSTPKSAVGKKAEAESAPNQQENQWSYRSFLRWLTFLFGQSKEAKMKMIQTLVDHLPEEGKQKVIQTMIQKAIQALVVNTTVKFSDQLPPPEDFKQYNQTLPGAADRILTAIEENIAETQRNAKRRIRASNFLGFCLFVVIGIAIWNGHQWAAAALGVAGASTAIWRRK